MKRHATFPLIICICLIIQSCLFSEKAIFEGTSSERKNQAVNELKTLLQSAENGWLMEYYLGDEKQHGGYNVLAKFDKDKVTLTSELEPIGKTSSSLYTIGSSLGAQLSFDVYNEILHKLCERVSYHNPGDQGDYEFTVQSTSNDKIILMGKKYKNELALTKFVPEVKWTTFLENIINIQSTAVFRLNSLSINGTKKLDLEKKRNCFFSTNTSQNAQKNTSYPYIWTEVGIKLFEPMTVDGITMTTFKWDASSRSYVCTNEGVDAKITASIPKEYKFYKDFIGTYTFKCEEKYIEPVTEERKYTPKEYTVNISPEKEGATYRLTGLIADIILKYDPSEGRIIFKPHILDTKIDGFFPAVTVGVKDYFNATWYALKYNIGGFFSKVTREDPFTFIFEDDGTAQHFMGDLTSLVFDTYGTENPTDDDYIKWVAWYHNMTIAKVN